MIEEWRPVPGFEGAYAVSNLGRVKSLRRTIIRANGTPYLVSERIMSCAIKGNGYLYVSLRKTEERQVVKRPTNLEWCTHARNMAHAWDNGLVPWPRKART